MPSDYERIATAIRFLEQQQHRQPSLAELATAVHLSPLHLQQLFQRWAGVSSKRFLQFLTVEHAKPLVDQAQDGLDTPRWSACRVRPACASRSSPWRQSQWESINGVVMAWILAIGSLRIYMKIPSPCGRGLGWGGVENCLQNPQVATASPA